MNTPDIVVAGVKKNGKDRIVLVKNTEHGSILVEEVLSGRRNKTLNAKTFWIMDKTVDEAKIQKILTNTNGYDVSKIKVASLTGTNSVLSSSKDEGGSNSAVKTATTKGQDHKGDLSNNSSIADKADSVNGGIVKYRGYTIRDIKDGDKGFENMDREKYVVIETPRGNTFMLPVLREKAHNFIDEAAKDAIEEAEVYAKVKGYGEQERLMLLESYAENQKTKRGRAAKRILQQVKKHGDVDFDRFEKYFLVDINEGAKG